MGSEGGSVPTQEAHPGPKLEQGRTQALIRQAPGSLLALSSVSGRPCER